jgi:hypothetical protein
MAMRTGKPEVERRKRRKFYGREGGIYEHAPGKLVRIYDSLFFAEKKWYSACESNIVTFFVAPDRPAGALEGCFGGETRLLRERRPPRSMPGGVTFPGS